MTSDVLDARWKAVGQSGQDLLDGHHPGPGPRQFDRQGIRPTGRTAARRRGRSRCHREVRSGGDRAFDEQRHRVVTVQRHDLKGRRSPRPATSRDRQVSSPGTSSGSRLWQHRTAGKARSSVSPMRRSAPADARSCRGSAADCGHPDTRQLLQRRRRANRAPAARSAHVPGHPGAVGDRSQVDHTRRPGARWQFPAKRRGQPGLPHRPRR